MSEHPSANIEAPNRNPPSRLHPTVSPMKIEKKNTKQNTQLYIAHDG